MIGGFPLPEYLPLMPVEALESEVAICCKGGHWWQIFGLFTKMVQQPGREVQHAQSIGRHLFTKRNHLGSKIRWQKILFLPWHTLVPLHFSLHLWELIFTVDGPLSSESGA